MQSWRYGLVGFLEDHEGTLLAMINVKVRVFAPIYIVVHDRHAESIHRDVFADADTDDYPALKSDTDFLAFDVR